MKFREVYDAHVGFVWRALRHLGVSPSDVPDAAQEVFLVVHRRLGEFEPRAKISSWLFAICSRVASDRRRLAHARRERATSPFEYSEYTAGEAAEGDPAILLDGHRARQVLHGILDKMPMDQRLVFWLFELEEMSGDEIAQLLDVPVGTVRSRLRLAREAFASAVKRLQMKEGAVPFASSLAREA